MFTLVLKAYKNCSKLSEEVRKAEKNYISMRYLLLTRISDGVEGLLEVTAGRQFTNAVKFAVVCGVSRYGMALEGVLWVDFR